MMVRHGLARLTVALLLAGGCSSSHEGGDGDGGTPGPDGSDGVCCPVTDFSGCSPGSDKPGGGWARSLEECTYTIGGYDGRPFVHETDEHGCEIVREADSGCCGCVPEEDAGPGSDPCVGLGPDACLQMGCVPTYDDACCPTCGMTGMCADCTRFEYYECHSYADACTGSSLCSQPASWGCRETVVPDCSDANPVGELGCDIAGCVPSFPTGEGEPSLAEATCVPITDRSCTVTCRMVEPTCPTGTVAEGDGSCYTDRCIPAFVCE